MSLRDEYPCIRYRRKLDYSIESKRFTDPAHFESEGGKAAGWARSPKEVEREPKAPPAPAPAPVVSLEEAKKRKPRSAVQATE